MRNFTLGIIGGCLSHQAGVQKSDLYHQRLIQRLEEVGHARMRVRIARDFDEEHRMRLESLMARGHLDGVLLHVRSAFVRKCSLITMCPTPTDIRYYIHPFLFCPWRTGWVEVENAGFARCLLVGRRRKDSVLSNGDGPGGDGSVPARDGPRPGIVAPPTRVAGIAIRDVLYLGGVLTGMLAWAIRDELRMVRDLWSRCTALGLPLFVLGPSRWPDYRWHDRLTTHLDTRLRSALDAWVVPYRGLRQICDDMGERLYQPDGVHFTPRGHVYAARVLAGMFEAWFDERARSGPQP